MANYTINEIPDTATEVGNSDLAVVWQNNATKKISILNLLKTLVKKSEVTNTVSATSESVITSKGVSSLLTIPASNTTITNAPPLQNNATYRFFFTEQITGSDDTSAMSISYNGTSYSVKATSNGSLKDFTAYPIATEQTRGLKKGEKSEEEKGETKSGTRATVTTYVYCQAYTTLEMMFDGTKFVIMGNPVVISNSDYTVYTDGSITYTKTKTDNLLLDPLRISHLSLSGGTTKDIPLSLIPQGIFLIATTFLYSSWQAYDFGIIKKYSATQYDYVPISGNAGVSVANDKISFNQFISSCVLIQIGYWS